MPAHKPGLEQILFSLKDSGAFMLARLPGAKRDETTLLDDCDNDIDSILKYETNTQLLNVKGKDQGPPGERNPDKLKAFFASQIKNANILFFAANSAFKDSSPGKTEFVARAAADYLYYMKGQFGDARSDDFEIFKKACIEQWCGGGTFSRDSGLGINKDIINKRYKALVENNGNLISADKRPSGAAPTIDNILEGVRDKQYSDEKSLAEAIFHYAMKPNGDLDLNKVSDLLTKATESTQYTTEEDEDGKTVRKNKIGLTHLETDDVKLLYNAVERLKYDHPELINNDTLDTVLKENARAKGYGLIYGEQKKTRSQVRWTSVLLGPLTMILGIAAFANSILPGGLLGQATLDLLADPVRFSSFFAGSGIVLGMAIPAAVALVAWGIEYMGNKMNMPKVAAFGNYFKRIGGVFTAVYGFFSMAGLASLGVLTEKGLTIGAALAGNTAVMTSLAAYALYVALPLVGFVCLASLARSVYKEGFNLNAPALTIKGKSMFTQRDMWIGLAVVGAMLFMATSVLTSGALPLAIVIGIPVVAGIYAAYQNYRGSNAQAAKLAGTPPEAGKVVASTPVVSTELNHMAGSKVTHRVTSTAAAAHKEAATNTVGTKPTI